MQASSKLVEVDVACASCKNGFTPVDLTGQVSPANLQSAASGGAIAVDIFDSNGNPVQGATVTVQSTATSSVTDTDVTNDSGVLDVIGVPAGYQVYHVTATKSGYSTASTSPNITVVQGQITNMSLEIDQLSSLSISSVSPTCALVGNFAFNLTGSKTSGGSPLYSQNLTTNSAGSLALNSMIPDTYTLAPKSSGYDTNGITPFSPFALAPAAAQNLQLVVVPANEDSFMITVEDGTTGKPLSGAKVELSGSGYDQAQTTGQGYFDQTNWSDGATQPGAFSDPSAYAAGSGVDTQTASSTGSILLFWDGIHPYNTGATGTLESSIFDTGTTSNFYSLNWSPSSQPVLAGATPVGFQFATAPSSTPNGPWNFLGPDGTSNTYYTVPGTPISSVNNSGEYARYETYVTTKTATVTPSVNDVSFTYTSGCIPPGQVLFQGLSAGSYTLTVSESGYTTSVTAITIGAGWQSKTILLAPSGS